MTSIAFVSGVMPLALSTGAGSGGENAIGTGVVGGMLAATILAIFFVPVFFVVMLRLFRVQPRKNGEATPESEGPKTGEQSRINAELQGQLNQLYEMLGLQSPEAPGNEAGHPGIEAGQGRAEGTIPSGHNGTKSNPSEKGPAV
jgi:hypothetical protein